MRSKERPSINFRRRLPALTQQRSYPGKLFQSRAEGLVMILLLPVPLFVLVEFLPASHKKDKAPIHPELGICGFSPKPKKKESRKEKNPIRIGI